MKKSNIGLHSFLIIIVTFLFAFFLCSCEKETYKVVFEIDDHIYITVETDGTEITIPPDPKKNGYIFYGWFDESGERVEKDALRKKRLTSDIRLYGKWITEKSYTITFDATGGTAVVNRLTAHGGEKIEQPSYPFYDGYSFQGWYIDSDLSKPFEFSEMPKRDFTLYAKWAINTELFNFSAYEDGWAVSAKSKTSNVLIIPETFEGKPVLRLDMQAFYSLKDLTTLVIPHTLEEFGRWSISNCNSLKSIRIPDNIRLIEENAFSGSSFTQVELNLSSWAQAEIRSLPFDTYTETKLFVDGEQVTHLVIPETVRKISNHAFNGLKTITKLTVNNSVETIGEYAFKNCAGLTEVIIENGVESIKKNAFQGCINLTEFTIPSSVTEIKADILIGCEKLEKLSVPLWEPVYTEDGYLPTIQHLAGSDQNKKIKEVTVSGGNKIGNFAFAECHALEKVTITAGVTAIGAQSFRNCRALTEFAVRGGIERIEEAAFLNAGLTSITLPWGLLAIETNAFKNCDGLTNIVIPETVTEIGERIFEGCTKFTAITLPFLGRNINDREKGTLKFSFDNNSVPADEYLSITLTKASIVADNAFNGSFKLESVTLPDTLTEIGEKAFYNCTKINSMTIPDSVVSIGLEAFKNCTQLAEITFGNGLKSVGKNCFEGTKWYDDKENYYVVYAGKVAYKHKGAVISGSILVAGGTVAIADGAFEGLSFQSVILPESLAHIGKNAFKDCDSLSSAVFSQSGGWSVSAELFSVGGTVDVSDAAGCALLLKETYSDYYWNRQA